jgi:hypothetical protein
MVCLHQVFEPLTARLPPHLLNLVHELFTRAYVAKSQSGCLRELFHSSAGFGELLENSRKDGRKLQERCVLRQMPGQTGLQ